MTGSQVKEALEALAKLEYQKTAEIKAEFDKQMQILREPFDVAYQRLIETCPHEFEYKWTHPDNGDELYECKFCKKSR